MRKKRFGVSIPIELAEELDKLANILACDRSRLVTHALRSIISEYKHYGKPHHCLGVIICTKPIGKTKSMEFVEEFRDIIKSYNHIHVRDLCIELYIVEGDSRRISRLHSKLDKSSNFVKYIPLLAE
ncbi:MAG: CopG family transcriptional regulator [Thermoprotei archaeon]